MRFPQIFLLTLSFLTVASALPNPFNIFKKKLIKPEDVTTSLDKYISKIRVLVTEEGIDKAGFREVSQRYRKELYKCAVQAERFRRNETIFNQLELAKEYHNTMSKISNYVINPRCNAGSNPPQDLLSDIRELWMCLLLVEDTHGNPDPNIGRYQEMVPRFRSRMERFESEYSSLFKVNSFDKSNLENWIKKVDKDIKRLEAGSKTSAP